ncbi:hypothetical protein J4219_04855 [Candidatus Woesearchaeota archaeon]|nr:hypothetical protein [Candidatus Woesearchaeota archaeon]
MTQTRELLPPRPTAGQRRRELKDLIENAGVYAVNQSFLAKKFNVSQAQISKDVKLILTDVQPEDLQPARINMHLALSRGIAECQKILVTTENKELKLKAVVALAKVCDSYTKFAECWGLKPITPQLIQNSPDGLKAVLVEVFGEQPNNQEVIIDGR